MAETILGLELTDHTVRAVKIRRISFKKFEIDRAAEEKLEITSLEEKAELIKEFVIRNGLVSDRIVCNFPGDRIFFRSTVLPFSDVKKIARTIKYEFEPTLPVAVEDLVAGFIHDPEDDGKTRVFGALVFKEDLSELIEMLQTADTDPEIVTLSGMALGRIVFYKNTEVKKSALVVRLDSDRTEIVYVVDGKGRAVRSYSVGIASIARDSGIGIDEAQLEGKWFSEFDRSVEIFKERYSMLPPQKIFIAGEVCENYELLQAVKNIININLDVQCEPLVTPEDPAIPALSEILGKDRNKYSVALGLALVGLARNDTLNLRQDQFAVRLRFKNIKKDLINVAVGLAAVVVLLMGNLFFQVSTDKKIYNYWNKKLEKDFRTVFPKGIKMIKPVAQMEARVSEATKMVEFFAGEDYKASALDILRVIHQSIPENMKVTLTNLSIDPVNLRISGQTDSYNTVDKIKNLLEKTGYFTNIKITNAKVNRSRKGVSFKMLIKRAK